MVRRLFALSFALSLIAAGLGCNTEPLAVSQAKPQGPTTRMEAPEGVHVPDIALNDQQEVDIVENLLLHRAMYKKTLLVLRDYYRDNGYANKQQWAEQELRDLERVRPYKYILSAEVPQKSNQAVDRVTEADMLYEKGLALMKKGGHGTPVFYRQDIMKQAFDTFVELVNNYPNSDKIDDAAFMCGEILKEYFKDQERLAVMWYERAKQWNPRIEHPVCFQAAVIYDFRLHDRDKALEWYNRVLTDEPWEESNRSFASRRIYQLSREMGTPDLDIPYGPEPAAMPAHSTPPDEVPAIEDDAALEDAAVRRPATS
jgi:tetratricopeptide (TPR) repeat protein